MFYKNDLIGLTVIIFAWLAIRLQVNRVDLILNQELNYQINIRSAWSEIEGYNYEEKILQLYSANSTCNR